MRGLQGRCVVRAVARDGHHLPQSLQGFDKPFLVHRPGARYDLQVHHAVTQFGVAQGRELWSGNLLPVAVGRLPQANLPSDLAGRPRRVTGDDFDGDAGVEALLDSCGNFLAHGVGYGDDAHERQIVRHDPAVADDRCIVRQFLPCEAQRAHGLILIGQQAGIDVRLGHSAFDRAAQTENDFRSAFDVEHAPPRQERRFHDRGHVFPLGRERELLYDRGFFPYAVVIRPGVVQP